MSNHSQQHLCPYQCLVEYASIYILWDPAVDSEQLRRYLNLKTYLFVGHSKR